MNTKTDSEILAYLAGVTDGEGCIRIERRPPSGPQKTPKFTLSFSVQMSEKPVIELFAARFNGTIIRRTFIPKDGETRRTAWRFQVHAKKAVAVIAALHPFLVGKKDQAALCLEFHANCSAKRMGRRTTEAEIAERMAYHDAVTSLKRANYF